MISVSTLRERLAALTVHYEALVARMQTDHAEPGMYSRTH
jgi:hypothetical protein